MVGWICFIDAHGRCFVDGCLWFWTDGLSFGFDFGDVACPSAFRFSRIFSYCLWMDLGGALSKHDPHFVPPPYMQQSSGRAPLCTLIYFLVLVIDFDAIWVCPLSRLSLVRFTGDRNFFVLFWVEWFWYTYLSPIALTPTAIIPTVQSKFGIIKQVISAPPGYPMQW